MAFPEGKRSQDGRLMEFKGGLFSMAVKTGVPIVPLSISNTHAVMPSYSFFPVQSGAGKLHVHVHDAIDTAGKTEEELSDMVREAFLSQLPADQHPLHDDRQAEVVEDAFSAPITVQMASETSTHSDNHQTTHQLHHHDAEAHTAVEDVSNRQSAEERVKEIA